jgi:hypothetical protein
MRQSMQVLLGDICADFDQCVCRHNNPHQPEREFQSYPTLHLVEGWDFTGFTL